MLKEVGKTLDVGTALVQRVVIEQPRPFDVHVAEAALSSLNKNRDGHRLP
jgi:hypothetical protein